MQAQYLIVLRSQAVFKQVIGLGCVTYQPWCTKVGLTGYVCSCRQLKSIRREGCTASYTEQARRSLPGTSCSRQSKLRYSAPGQLHPQTAAGQRGNNKTGQQRFCTSAACISNKLRRYHRQPCHRFKFGHHPNPSMSSIHHQDQHHGIVASRGKVRYSCRWGLMVYRRA